MKNVLRVVSAVSFVVQLSASALAQTAVPPPPRPADSGPSLEATMKFIQDKLNDIGKVNYVIFRQNTYDGSTNTSTTTVEISNVVADQSQCRISYLQKVTVDGRALTDFNAWITLRDVQNIVVKPMAQLQTESDASLGQPNIITTSTSPPMTTLLVRSPHGWVLTFPFTDADLADRVAKALTHAVELCGGGNKDPF